MRIMLGVLAGSLLCAASGSHAHDNDHRGHERYEVWAVDQSSSPGTTYGGTLYVYEGAGLVRHPRQAVPEIVNLAGAVSEMCFAKTGVNPVRPHMLAMNADQTHAILSFVASGHVVIMDAATRAPVDCIRTSIGAGGARQVHFAIPSPDQKYLAVANQNGKLFERINTDYQTNTFVLDTAAGINLATCVTPNGYACQDPTLRPDNAPICPIVESTSRFVYVTLRGGGLFVVDATRTPMEIVAEYDIENVHPNGCLGVQVGRKMYIDSGGGTAANLFGADVYAFPVTGFSAGNPPNTPPRKVVLTLDAGQEHDEGPDAHGATLTQQQRRLWVADRGRNLIWVFDTRTDELLNEIHLEGEVSDDPTPDLLQTSPDGQFVFMSLRGPNPLTADPHVSTGSTPGVGVIKVTAGGRDGRFYGLAAATNLDATGIERADIHAMTIRVLPGKRHGHH
jgi:DNA-binding beta-propeller fold protein YncE